MIDIASPLRLRLDSAALVSNWRWLAAQGGKACGAAIKANGYGLGAREVMRDLRVHIPSLTAEVGQLSGGQRQSIALGRATAQHGRVIIMDEPTAALGVRESRKVLDLILRLKATGTGVVIVSHNLRHVFSVADRILVLRHGQRVGLRDKTATAPDEIVKMIVGVEML